MSRDESLNAAFYGTYDEEDDSPLLQDSDFFETPTVPGEFPTLREDRDFIAVIESRIEDVSYLVQSIQNAGGMSKQFALEALEVAEDFPKVPIGAYSTLPTATRYKVSLESLIDSIGKGFKKLVEFIRKLIRRVILWIRGDAVSGDVSDSQFRKAELDQKRYEEKITRAAEGLDDQYVKAIEAIRELNQDTGYLTKVLPTNQFETIYDFIQKSSEFEPRLKRSNAFNNSNTIVADAIYQGKYTTYLNELAQTVESGLRGLVDFNVLIDETLRYFGHDKGTGNYSRAIQNLERFIAGRYVELKRGGATSWEAVVEQATEARHQAIETRLVVGDIPLLDILNAFLPTANQATNLSALASRISSCMSQLFRMEASIGAFEDRLQDMEFGEAYKAGNEAMVEVLRKAVGRFAQDVSFYARTLFILREQMGLVAAAKGDMMSLIDNAIDYVVSSGKQRSIPIPQTLRPYVQSMLDRRKRIYDNYYQLRFAPPRGGFQLNSSGI